jgi:putative addiction module component (TIGR02574 family)
MQTIPAQDIFSMSIPERIQLAEDIWDSIAADQHSVQMTHLQQAVLNERLAEYAKNPNEGDSWNEVRKRLWQAL